MPPKAQTLGEAGVLPPGRRPRAGAAWPAALVLLACALRPGGSVAASHCIINRLGELPVTMHGTRPLVHARINGVDALFLADSGALFNTLTPAAAAEFKLSLTPAPWNFHLQGVGGEVRTWVTEVKTFTIFNLNIPQVPFLVAGNDLGGGAVGLLGQNVFRIADTEYDLANGVIRVVRPHDCEKALLAYWATGPHAQPFSVIDIDPATPQRPHTQAVAYVNGNKIHVLFDTGSSTSVLALQAAQRAGVTPASAGVVSGSVQIGIGRHTVSSWIAPFTSFKIGDEEVRNTHLRIGATGIEGVDMLIGADFFLSHRIYVASSQRKLYFTYNGGPVFDLTATPAPQAPADNTADAAAEEHPQGTPDEPTDAAGLARRGAASAARHDYGHALADLTRACELSPTEASYFYERGLAHWGNKDADLALADFDEALKLRPDDVPSLLARASLHAGRHDPAAAIVADLDAADRAAPKEADVRLQMGRQYASLGEFAAAIGQYTRWIDTHGREDVQMPWALNLRCWARALSATDLDRALSDCDDALRLHPKTAAFLGSRGLVQLRRGAYDQAIADYGSALTLEPKSPWALYGRGIARLHKGQSVPGQADIAAATALQPKVAEQMARYGIQP